MGSQPVGAGPVRMCTLEDAGSPDVRTGPRHLLEKQNTGATFTFYLKLERGSGKVTLIPLVDQYLLLHPSLIFPLRTVALRLCSLEGQGVLGSIIVGSGVLVEGAERASDCGQVEEG